MFEIMDSSSFGYGLLLGAAIILLVALLSKNAYRQLLVMCAMGRTPEKIGRNFYYIVEEQEYNTLRRTSMLRASPPEQMQATH